MTHVVPGRFAVMAIDPGGTTGVAAGLFNVARTGLSVGAVLERSLERRCCWAGQLKGSPGVQARELVRRWTDLRFRWNVELRQPLNNCYLVVERFDLRQRSADLSPCYVLGGIEALWAGELERQSASDAKTYATDARLRSWGLWVRGQEHARDANRHLALKVARLLG